MTNNPKPRSALDIAKDVANPLNKTAGFALPHFILTGIVLVVVGLALGVFAGAKYTEHFFAATYRAPLPVPTTKATAPLIHVAFASAASINQTKLPGVYDQGPIGSCAAQVSSTILSWEWRTNHPGSWLRWSRRWMYDWYSNHYSNGADAGSWPDQDAESATTTGIPREKQFAYPPFVIDSPVSPNIYTLAASGRFTPHFYSLTGFAEGAGQGAVDAIRGAITGATTADRKPHPVFIALSVFPSFDNANATGGNIGAPSPGDTSRGGHEITGIAYDDTRPMPDGTVGAVEIRNSWSTRWGLNGNAWLGYSYIRAHAFGIEYATIRNAPAAPQSKITTPPFVGGIGHLVPPPSRPSVGVKTFASQPYYVRGVRAADRNLDLSPLFNAAGVRYHLPPYGLAATFASECGLKTGVNGDCNRYGGGADVSGGGCQVTIGTAAGYGIGDGSYSASNIQNVFTYENNPANCIDLEARIMHTDSVYRGGANYRELNILWNCGPATTSYPVPFGQCASNFDAFNGWFNYSLTHWAVSVDPNKPKPKPASICHGPRLRLQWFRDGHGGWLKETFRDCFRLTWPRFHYAQREVKR